MVCATEDGQVVLNGEVMFAGWSDTSSKGQIVKFWLDDEASTHPFAGFRPRGRDGIGTIFGVALVEMTDDDKPVDQVAEKSLAEAHGKPRKRGLSQDAHFMIINEKFIQYVRETVNLKPGTEVNAELARRWVKHRLQIESLGDLDHNPEKAKLFHQVIRRPYARWNGEDC